MTAVVTTHRIEDETERTCCRWRKPARPRSHNA